MAYRSSSVLASATAANGAVPVPTGSVSGDIVTVYYYMESATAVTPPTGFLLKASYSTTSTSRGRIDVFWKRLTASDTGTYTFTHTSAYRGAIAISNSGRIASGDPFNAIGSIEGTAGSTTSVNPGCTTTVTGCDLVGAASNFSAGLGSWTAPSGMTGQQVGNTTEIAGFTADNIASGATGTKTFTYSMSGVMKSFVGALAPVSSSASVTGVAGTSTSGGNAPTFTLAPNINSVAGTSASQGMAPLVSGIKNASVTAVAGTTTSSGVAPVFSGTTNANVNSVAGVSTSNGAPPVVSGTTVGNYTGWGNDVPSGGPGPTAITFAGDSNEGVFSACFQTSASGQQAVGARIYVPAAATGDLTGSYGYLYATDPATGYPTGAALATSGLTNLAIGWNNLNFITPYNLVAAATYYVAVYIKGNVYGYISHAYDADLNAPSGASGLKFMGSTTAHQNGAYIYSGPGGLPNSSFGATSYGVDGMLSSGVTSVTVNSVVGTSVCSGNAPVVTATLNANVAATAGTASSGGVAPVVNGTVNVSVNAVAGTSASLGNSPTVVGSSSANVNSVVGTSSSTFFAPIVSGIVNVIVNAVAANSSAAGRAPVLSGTSAATVNSVVGTSSSAAGIAAVSGSATVRSVFGACTSTAIEPTAIGEIVVAGGGPGASSAAGQAPVVKGTINVTTNSVAGTSSSSGVAPAVSSTAMGQVNAVAGTSSATGNAPVANGTIFVTVVAVAGVSNSQGMSPTVSGITNATKIAVAGTSSAAGNSPVIFGVINVTVNSISGSSSSGGNAPSVAGQQQTIINATRGISNSIGIAPIFVGGAIVNSVSANSVAAGMAGVVSVIPASTITAIKGTSIAVGNNPVVVGTTLNIGLSAHLTYYCTGGSWRLLQINYHW